MPLPESSDMQRPVSIVVPFRLDGAKSRLSPALTVAERREMALAMLRDVLACIGELGELTILTRPGWDMGEDIWRDLAGQDIKIMPSDLELNHALNMVIEREILQGWRRDLLIVMADLALLEKGDIEGVISCPGDVVLCPGRGRNKYYSDQKPQISYLLPGTELSQTHRPRQEDWPALIRIRVLPGRLRYRPARGSGGDPLARQGRGQISAGEMGIPAL